MLFFGGGEIKITSYYLYYVLSVLCVFCVISFSTTSKNWQTENVNVYTNIPCTTEILYFELDKT